MFGAKSSDVVVDVVTGAGLLVGWSLNQRQNYSHSTPIREYRVRVAAALDKLGDAQRLRVLVGILRGVLSRGISDVDTLNAALADVARGRAMRAMIEAAATDFRSLEMVTYANLAEQFLRQ